MGGSFLARGQTASVDLSFFLKHALSQQECMPARYGPLLTNGWAQKWQPAAEVDSEHSVEPSWGENHYTNLENSSRKKRKTT
eukprot:1156800-Pelagomonas_calceolata.AAC.1